MTDTTQRHDIEPSEPQPCDHLTIERRLSRWEANELRPDTGLTIHVILALKAEGLRVSPSAVSRAIAHTLDYLNARRGIEGGDDGTH